MNSKRVIIFVMLLLSLPALACGTLMGGEEATATPFPQPAATDEPAVTAVPTEPPQPTATTSPTDTPEPSALPAGDFTTYSSDLAGITVTYPADWAIVDLFFVGIASDEALLEDTTGAVEGGLVVIFSDDIAEFEGNDPVEILSASSDELDLGEDASFVSEPMETQIQGQDAAIGTIAATAEDGTPLTALAAVIVSGDRAAIAFGATPTASEDEFLPTLEAIIRSIQLGEPSEDFGFSFGDPEPAGETIVINVDDVFDHAIPEGTYQDYSFQGTAGVPFSVLVEPGAEFDPVVAVFRADDLEEALVEIDDGFSEESELLAFIPPDDGEYIIRVRGFSGEGGDYTISLAEGEAVPVGDAPTLAPGDVLEGDLAEDDEPRFVLTAAAGEEVLLVLSTSRGDLDLILALDDASGNSIESVDSGFSGDSEVLVFTPETAGDYIVRIDSFGFSDAAPFTLIRPDLTRAFDTEGEVVGFDGFANFRVCVPAGEGVIAVVLPEEDFDAILVLQGPGGGTISDTIDDGFSGEPEAIYFTDAAETNDGDYAVIVNVTGFTDGGTFRLLIMTDGEGAVVPDGC